MKKLTLLVYLAVVLTVMVGCSALNKLKNGDSTKPAFNLSGSWEVVATSTANPGVYSYVEFNAKQDGGGNINTPVQEFILGTSATNYANCLGVTPGNPQGNITAMVGSDNIQGTFTETGPTGSAMFDINTSLSSATSFSGNYAPMNGTGTMPSECVDTGTYVATKASSLAGTYNGQLTYPDGSKENVSATMTEDAAYNVTVTGTATGGMQDGPLNFTGTISGNLAVLHGTNKNGDPLTLFAWWGAPPTGGASPAKLYILDNNGYEYGALARQ